MRDCSVPYAHSGLQSRTRCQCYLYFAYPAFPPPDNARTGTGTVGRWPGGTENKTLLTALLADLVEQGLSVGSRLLGGHHRAKMLTLTETNPIELTSSSPRTTSATGLHGAFVKRWANGRFNAQRSFRQHRGPRTCPFSPPNLPYAVAVVPRWDMHASHNPGPSPTLIRVWTSLD